VQSESGVERQGVGVEVEQQPNVKNEPTQGAVNKGVPATDEAWSAGPVGAQNTDPVDPNLSSNSNREHGDDTAIENPGYTYANDAEFAPVTSGTDLGAGAMVKSEDVGAA